MSISNYKWKPECALTTTNIRMVAALAHGGVSGECSFLTLSSLLTMMMMIDNFFVLFRFCWNNLAKTKLKLWNYQIRPDSVWLRLNKKRHSASSRMYMIIITWNADRWPSWLFHCIIINHDLYKRADHFSSTFNHHQHLETITSEQIKEFGVFIPIWLMIVLWILNLSDVVYHKHFIFILIFFDWNK